MGIQAQAPARGWTPPPGTIWSEASRDGRESRMDVETAVWLRCHLGAVFDRAESWQALAEALAAKDFELAFNAGRLSLVNRRTGVVLCTCRFVGYGLPELVARLGKPHVDAATGRLIWTS